MIDQHKVDTYCDAVYEAKRFIKKAEEAIKVLVDDEYATFGCKETAAAKRSSMDLTRALAQLRKA